MFSNFSIKAVLVICLFATACFCCSLAVAANFKAGDEVVTTYQTELKAGDKPLAVIPVGSYLRVQEIKPDWLKVTVTATGKTISGWVYAKHVQLFAEDQRYAKLKTASAVKRAEARQLITSEIIDAQSIPRDRDRVIAYMGIACDQVSAGDLAGAMATASLIGDQSQKAMTYWAIAYRQAKMGDSAGARLTLDLAREEAAQIKEDFTRSATYRLIARVQASVGDMAGAKATAEQISDQEKKSQTYFAIAQTQMKTGDWTGAKATALQIGDEDLKVQTQDEIVTAEAKTGGISAAFKFIASATSDPRASCELLRTAIEEIFHTR
jgi:hypothetical protein